MSATPARADYASAGQSAWQLPSSSPSSSSSSPSSSSSVSSSSTSHTSAGSNPRLPLHVTVQSPERTKALRFQPTETAALSFDTFYARIERCLQYEEHTFEIWWKDDDGEMCEISSTPELHEALAYFGPSDPASSVEQVSMRVTVRVESTVPLSDFGDTETDGLSENSGGEEVGGSYASTSSYPGIPSALRPPSYPSLSGSEASYRERPREGHVGDDIDSAYSRRIHPPPPDDQDPWASHFSSSSSSSSSSLPAPRRRNTRNTRRPRHMATTHVRGRDRSVGSNGSSLDGGDGDGEGSGSDTENEDGGIPAVAELRANDIDIPIDGRGMSGSVHRQGASSGGRLARNPTKKAVHDGILCSSCGTTPIVGNRFHCASCNGGADFCSTCEDTGEALDHPGHLSEHIVLKIAIPLDSQAAARTLSTKLAVAQHRLLSQSGRNTASETSSSPSGMDWPVAMHGMAHGHGPWSSGHGPWSRGSAAGGMGLPNWNRPGGFIHGHPNGHAGHAHPVHTPHGHYAHGHGHAQAHAQAHHSQPPTSGSSVHCSFCSEPLTTGPRYLCANCPLGHPDSPEGYNLCSNCEPHSLHIHDPRHFFLKIRLSTLAARGEAPSSFRRNPAIARGEGRNGLLPTLYREPEIRRGSPRGSRGVMSGVVSDHRSYVRSVELGMTGLENDGGGSGERKSSTERSAIGEAKLSNSQHPDVNGNPTPASSSLGTELKHAAMADAENMFRYLGLSIASIKNRYRPTPGSSSGTASASPSFGQRSTSESDRATAALELGGGGGAEGEHPNDTLEMRALEYRRANLVPLESLIHPNIVCDNCFEVIEGAWFKCCNCATCYDLCSRCESRMGHDPRHVFAVLKQPVDIDCFKSLADIFGPDSLQNKPLIPFLLV